ncbi:MAG: hypothetical protein ACLFSL_00855 [Candidatus Woesearchaeota archaeon]
MIKGRILIIIIMLSSFVFMTGCDFSEDNEKRDDDSTISYDEAEKIAEQSVTTSYQYVQHNGHELEKTRTGKGKDGQYIFSYEFSVDSDLLPERIDTFSAEVEVKDGDAEIVSMEEITG